MKPLIVLIIVFAVSLIVTKLVAGKFDYALSARVAMSAMLIFTAIGHFVFADGMSKMVPDFIPFKKEVIHFTGVIEIIAAIGLHIPQLQWLTGWLLILFFVVVLPANIKASIEQINYQTGELNGNGLAYLWFRVPLQVLFIIWVYFSAVVKW